MINQAVRADSVSDDDLIEIIQMLDRWAKFSRGWCGPRGAPRESMEYKTIFGPAGQDPEWPEDVCRTEVALTALGMFDGRKLRVIKWRWLGNYSYREIERRLRARNGSGRGEVRAALHALFQLM